MDTYMTFKRLGKAMRKSIAMNGNKNRWRREKMRLLLVIFERKG
jgi:hypothetical protein